MPDYALAPTFRESKACREAASRRRTFDHLPRQANLQTIGLQFLLEQQVVPGDAWNSLGVLAIELATSATGSVSR